jgi:hypothetical protein
LIVYYKKREAKLDLLFEKYCNHEMCTRKKKRKRKRKENVKTERKKEVADQMY